MTQRHLRLAQKLHDAAFNREMLLFSAIVTSLVLLWFTPATRVLPYRTLLSSITQDRVIAEVNPYRASIGATPLQVSSLLTEAARLKAEDMLNRDYFSHYGPAGELPWTWLSRVGYQYAGAGENLAIDFADPTSLVSAWLASPTHAANIKNGVFTELGIGIANGDFEGRDTTVVVMFLGKPLGASFATTTPAPEPPPQPSPAPAPQPSQTRPQPATPPLTPAPSPSPEPSPQPAPPATEPATPTTPTPEPENTMLPPLVSESLTQENARITKELAKMRPIVAPVSTPLHTTLLEFFLLKAALAMRWILSVAFIGTLAASALLYAMPSHRQMVKHHGVGTLALLLILLWLPEVL